MPSTFPRLEVDTSDEEARLEGPTAVSTPVRNTTSSSIADATADPEKKTASKVVNSDVVGLQEDPPQSDDINDGTEPIIVTFNHPFDPDNPYNWPRLKKIRIAILVLTYALVGLRSLNLPANTF